MGNTLISLYSSKLASTKLLVIIIVILLFILLGVAYLAFNINDDSSEKSDKEDVSAIDNYEGSSENISNEDTSETTVVNTDNLPYKTTNYDLIFTLNGEVASKLTAYVPSEYVVESPNEYSINVRFSDSYLAVGIPYEAEDTIIETFDEIGTTNNLGKVFRIATSYDYNPNSNFPISRIYTNKKDLNIDTDCAPAVTTDATYKCAPTTMSINQSNGSFYVARCHAISEDFSDCDEAVKKIVVHK